MPPPWDAQGIAAVIGALAWIPILFQLGAKWLVKPRLDVVIGDTAEVGFSSYLGVCNVQAAIRVSGKPALITSIGLLLVHQNGRRKELLWNGHSEVVSTFEMGGERGATTRVIPAVALHVRPDTDVWQRKVQLNDRAGAATMNDLANDLERRIEVLGASANFATVRATDEYTRLHEQISDGFFWESGTYTATMTVVVRELRQPVTANFTFSLTQLNVNRLRTNLLLVRKHVDDLTEATLGGTPAPPVPPLAWLNPFVRPTSVT